MDFATFLLILAVGMTIVLVLMGLLKNHKEQVALPKQPRPVYCRSCRALLQVHEEKIGTFYDEQTGAARQVSVYQLICPNRGSDNEMHSMYSIEKNGTYIG